MDVSEVFSLHYLGIFRKMVSNCLLAMILGKDSWLHVADYGSGQGHQQMNSQHIEIQLTHLVCISPRG